MVRNDILPALGKLKVALVEYGHIERLHARISERAPVRANHVVSMTLTMFNLAIRWKLRTDNPAKGIARNREHQRRRYASADEIARFDRRPCPIFGPDSGRHYTAATVDGLPTRRST
jgi:hypothetical protein